MTAVVEGSAPVMSTTKKMVSVDHLYPQLLNVLRKNSMTCEQLSSYYSIKYGLSLSEQLRAACGSCPTTKGTSGASAGATALRALLEARTDLFEFDGDRVRGKDSERASGNASWKRQQPKQSMEATTLVCIEREWKNDDEKKKELATDVDEKENGDGEKPPRKTAPLKISWADIVDDEEWEMFGLAASPVPAATATTAAAATKGPVLASHQQSSDADTGVPAEVEEQVVPVQTIEPNERFVVEELVRILKDTGHAIAHSSVLCSQFMHRQNVSVTQASACKPMDLFKKSPEFLWLSSGNVALREDENHPSVQQQLRLLRERPKEARVKEAALEAQLPPPEVVTAVDVVEYFQKLILSSGGDSMYISALCGRFMQRFKRPVTAVVGCKPVDFFKRHSDVFLTEMGGHVRLASPPSAWLLEKLAQEEGAMCPPPLQTTSAPQQQVAAPAGTMSPPKKSASQLVQEELRKTVEPKKKEPKSATVSSLPQERSQRKEASPGSGQLSSLATTTSTSTMPSLTSSARLPPWRSRTLLAVQGGQGIMEPTLGEPAVSLGASPPSSGESTGLGCLSPPSEFSNMEDFVTPPQTPRADPDARLPERSFRSPMTEVRVPDAEDEVVVDTCSSLWRRGPEENCVSPLHRFCEELQRRCCLSFQVFAMVLDGVFSSGKESPPEEADLVLFVRDLPLDRHRAWLPAIMNSTEQLIQTQLVQSDGSAKEVRREGSHIGCTVTATGTDLRLFVSPIYPSPENLREFVRSSPAKDRIFFQPSFVEERLGFLEEHAGERSLARSAAVFLKDWSARQLWSSNLTTPPSYLLQLIAVYAARLYEDAVVYEEEAGGEWAKGLRGYVLEVCADFKSLRLIWQDIGVVADYNLEEVPKELLEQKPLLLDPVNCHRNVADPSCFDGFEFVNFAARALGRRTARAQRK